MLLTSRALLLITTLWIESLRNNGVVAKHSSLRSGDSEAVSKTKKSKVIKTTSEVPLCKDVLLNECPAIPDGKTVPDYSMLCSVPLECVYGTESCCGETFDSVKCVCSPTTGWTCLLTDACLKKSCTPSTSPSEGGANAENSTDILLKGCPHIPDGDTFPDFSMLCSVPLDCFYGTESCCGENFDHIYCKCSPTAGWTCLFTDACYRKSCTPSKSPTAAGANTENSNG